MQSSRTPYLTPLVIIIGLLGSYTAWNKDNELARNKLRALGDHNPAFEFLELDVEPDVCGVLTEGDTVSASDTLKKLFFAEPAGVLDGETELYHKVIPAGQFREFDGANPGLITGYEANEKYHEQQGHTDLENMEYVNNNEVCVPFICPNHVRESCCQSITYPDRAYSTAPKHLKSSTSVVSVTADG